MNSLYTIEELRLIEEKALAKVPAGTLMQRAGKSAADLALKLLVSHDKNTQVLVLAGPGNNGGDAIEMAILLAEKKMQVSVLPVSTQPFQSKDAQLAQKRAEKSSIQWLDPLKSRNLPASLSDRKWHLVVDGMFGIGLTKPLTGLPLELTKIVNSMNCPVLALDVPSGLNANTGSVLGEDGVAVKATDTLTFLGDKPGLHTFQGKDHAGTVHVDHLEVDKALFAPSGHFLNAPLLFSALLKKRRHDSHKGTYGKLAVLGGAKGMGGAPVLAARSALYCGAGLVYTVFLEEPCPYCEGQPELMFRFAPDFDFSEVVSVVGPGLGMSRSAEDFLETILKQENPLVCDADAINILSGSMALQEILRHRHIPTILTPHPLEAARLLDTTTKDIQSNRLLAAREIAKRLNVVVALKGSGTVIGSPDGKIAINPTGGPALATAGTGDVLSGICGALLTQGWPAWEAALASVWMHGKAADELVQNGYGPIGLTAGELIPEMRRIFNRLVHKYGN